jgi:uncharacterized membrane protein YagU involved in acid resistance
MAIDETAARLMRKVPGVHLETPPAPRSIAEAAFAGVVGAMAMTAVREFAGAMGWVKLTPPEDVVQSQAGSLLARVPDGRREAAVELLHWSYGAMGGAMFGALPRSWRSRLWVGPVYGLAAWAFFQAVLAPALGLEHADERPAAERATLVVDHLLYGLIVAEPGAA